MEEVAAGQLLELRLALVAFPTEGLQIVQVVGASFAKRLDVVDVELPELRVAHGAAAVLSAEQGLLFFLGGAPALGDDELSDHAMYQRRHALGLVVHLQLGQASESLAGPL